jgi:hypothetical protein
MPPGIDFFALSHCARDLGVTRRYSSSRDSFDLTIFFLLDVCPEAF